MHTKTVLVSALLSFFIFNKASANFFKNITNLIEGNYESLRYGISVADVDNNGTYEFIVEVKEMHLNTGKIAHGGFLSTIADTGMGTAAHRVAGDKRCVTINLDMKFISAGLLGDKLKGKVEILKKTNTLVFISCEISNSSDIVASASGTWKILK